MWNEIISMAMNNGLWAVLFCLLFLYQLKDSRRREHKYQDTVSRLTASLEIIKDIRDNCGEIKSELRRLKPSRESKKTTSAPTAGIASAGKAVGVAAAEICAG